MAKKPFRLSPLRSGRRVRWTVEVSADVGSENRARAKTTAKKRQRTKSSAKQKRRSPHPEIHASHDSVPSPATTTALPEAAPAVSTPSPIELWQPTRAQMVTLAGAAVLVIAMVAVPRYSPPGAAGSGQQAEQPKGTGEVAPSLPPEATEPAPRAAVVATSPVVDTPALTAPPKKSSARNVTSRNRAPAMSAPPVAAAAIDHAPVKDDLPAKAPESMRASPASPSAVSVATPVTITGCLEISTDGNEFRLADTEGAGAPKARSWRSGFLRKRTSPVALVEAPDPPALRKSVGNRVAATGLLAGRELKLSSLRVVGPSCN